MATFGNTANGTADSLLDTPDRIRGGNYTFNGGAGQQADSISVRLRRLSGSGDQTFKCMLYNHATNALVGTTETKAVALTTSFAWFTFNFTSKPALVNGTDYVIVVWHDHSVDCAMTYTDEGTSIDHYTDAYTFNGAPNPISFDTYVLSNPCIYATYTPAAGGQQLFCLLNEEGY